MHHHERYAMLCCVIRRGADTFQVESTTPTRDAAIPEDQRTFESLDALLIALSPAYVAAMQSELMKRFEGGPGPSRWRDLDDSDGDGAEDEPAWID